MSKKTAKIISYLTLTGWSIAAIAILFGEDPRGDEGMKQHLNQALIIGLILMIPLGITQVIALVFAIMGIVKACQDDDSALPVIGEWKIIK